MLPEAVGRRHVVLVGAHERARALLLEKAPRGVAEELLVVVEGEVH
jgi:hypothetical protein